MEINWLDQEPPCTDGRHQWKSRMFLDYRRSNKPGALRAKQVGKCPKCGVHVVHTIYWDRTPTKSQWCSEDPYPRPEDAMEE